MTKTRSRVSRNNNKSSNLTLKNRITRFFCKKQDICCDENIDKNL